MVKFKPGSKVVFSISKYKKAKTFNNFGILLSETDKMVSLHNKKYIIRSVDYDINVLTAVQYKISGVCRLENDACRYSWPVDWFDFCDDQLLLEF